MKFIFLIFISNTSWANFDETKIQIPLKDSNKEKLLPTVCRTNENEIWDLCSSIIAENHEMPKNFKIINLGENNTVPHSGNMIGREFTFMFQDMARSDLGLLVWDIPDENTNHGHLKLMMFFPRKVLPAINYNSEKNTITVTLPTREEVIFNSETKEIISGALKEAPIEQDNTGNAISPLVAYSGTGVVVEAHRLNEYPVGSIKTMATIKKSGHPDCLVPVNELWFTDEKKGGNVYFNKNFVTDSAFDQFIKSRCKFSIY
jgi:hypothetical protein